MEGIFYSQTKSQTIHDELSKQSSLHVRGVDFNSNLEWYLDTCPKNDVILFSRKCFIALKG